MSLARLGCSVAFGAAENTASNLNMMHAPRSAMQKNVVGLRSRLGSDRKPRITLKDLLAEVDRRGLSLDGRLSAVDRIPVKETLYYARARGLITEEELRKQFLEWRNGGAAKAARIPS